MFKLYAAASYKTQYMIKKSNTSVSRKTDDFTTVIMQQDTIKEIIKFYHEQDVFLKGRCNNHQSTRNN